MFTEWCLLSASPITGAIVATKIRPKALKLGEKARQSLSSLAGISSQADISISFSCGN